VTLGRRSVAEVAKIDGSSLVALRFSSPRGGSVTRPMALRRRSQLGIDRRAIAARTKSKSSIRSA
jgi:hypothetical protein